MLEAQGSTDYKLFFYTSPYRRSFETFESIAEVFPSSNLMGVQEEVQLREQDFGNFQVSRAGCRHTCCVWMRLWRAHHWQVCELSVKETLRMRLAVSNI